MTAKSFSFVLSPVENACEIDGCINRSKREARGSLVQAAASDNTECQVPKKLLNKERVGYSSSLTCCTLVCVCVYVRLCACVHLILIGIYGSLSTLKTRILEILIGLRRHVAAAHAADRTWLKAGRHLGNGRAVIKSKTKTMMTLQIVHVPI